MIGKSPVSVTVVMVRYAPLGAAFQFSFLRGATDEASPAAKSNPVESAGPCLATLGDIAKAASMGSCQRTGNFGLVPI
jgi:hypothetical protein